MSVIKLRDGATIWTAVSGVGPPVLCCHGGPGLWDYLEPLATLLDDSLTVVRFEQRGRGRSTGSGDFTIVEALDDLDQVRAAFDFERLIVIGHSWGAELAIRYAAAYPRRVSAVVYIAGVGAGEGYRAGYLAERKRRLGADVDRWRDLGNRVRTSAEEQEWCLLQWRPDYSPSADAAEHAAALWATRPPAAEINARAHRQLWADRETVDLLSVARQVRCPVTMLLGADDPRPVAASESLFEALPDAERVVLDGAGHLPWVEWLAFHRSALEAKCAGPHNGHADLLRERIDGVTGE